MSKLTLTNTLATLVVGCVLAQPIVANTITFDASTLGIAGASQFSADALKAREVSHIVFDSPTTFAEHGFGQITGILNNGVFSTPTGLNSDYTLYFDFTALGSLITSQITSFSFDFYAVQGASTFGIDGNNDAFVNNGANIPKLLATNTFIAGIIGGAPGTDLFALSISNFSPTANGSLSFSSPDLPRQFVGQFFHSMNEPGGITLLQNGIVLNGGDDTLQFVPEPSSALLLLSSLPIALFLRRKAAR